MSCEPANVIDIWELRGEAAEARCLAVKFKDRETISDLLNYAAALEVDATRYEQAQRGPRASALGEENFRRAAQANHYLTGARH